MQFELKNVGLVDGATVTLADLTIICGENNTGKTYVTIETMNEIQTEILFGGEL